MRTSRLIDRRSVLLCVALRAAGVAGCALLSALTWALLLPSAALAAPEVISLNSLKESWLLGAGAEVWIDEEGATSTLSEALERAEWRAARRPREAIRLRQGTLWVHARVRDDLPRGAAAPEWRVSFSHPRPVSLTSYVPRGGRLVELRGGLEQPLDAREVPSTSVVVPFEPRPGVVEDLYFKIESTPLGFAAHISSRDEWSRGELRAERLFGLYYGLALGLFLYNSFLLITLRDITYQWYLLVLLSNVLFFAARNGYIWAAGWTPSLLGGGGLVAIQIIAMLNFTRSLLMTHASTPRVDRLLRALLIVVNVMFIITLSWTTPIAELAMSPLSVMSVLLCLLAGSLRLTQGSGVARYFMLGGGFFLGGGVMYGVKFTGLIPHTPLTEHALQVGSALEMVLFSLALADRVRDLQRASTERKHELERVRLTHARDMIALRE